MILITITTPKQDPNKVLDSFLYKNNKATGFIPVLNVAQAESKKLDKILWYQKKLATSSASEFDYQKQLDSLKKMSLIDYIHDSYGFSEFDPKTNQFGYIGNRNARISSYSAGEPIFINFSGNKVSQAAKKDIDWNKMRIEGYEIAEKEAEKWQKTDDKEFIEIRYKVNTRPQVLIGKNRLWCDEESFDNFDANKSIRIYEEVWEKMLEEASLEDLFTHWTYSL